MGSTAVQVTRLIPGGVDIVGLFLIAAFSKLKRMVTKVKGLMMEARDAVQRDICWELAPEMVVTCFNDDSSSE